MNTFLQSIPSLPLAADLRGVSRSALALVCTAAATLSSATPAAAQAVEARVDLTSLLCKETTGEPFSDEPFVVGNWLNLQSQAKGKFFQPPPFTFTWNGVTTTAYPHFGNVDENEWVFDDKRTAFHGWIPLGQTVSIPINFMEKDSGYTADEYASDMLQVLIDEAPNLILYGSMSYEGMMKMALYSIDFIFGAGADDKLGILSLKLTNVGGNLQKQLITGKYSYIGGEFKDHRTIAWGTAQMKSLESQGYKVVSFYWSSTYFFTGFVYTMVKSTYYGPLSAGGKTVRVILSGDGPQKYQASVQVRTGPFNSTTPDGTCTTWTIDSSGSLSGGGKAH